MRSLDKSVAKIVDAFNVYLEQLVLTELGHEIIQAPIEVFHRLFIEAAILDRLHDRAREGTKQLVPVRPRRARSLDGRLLGGWHPCAALNFLEDAFEFDLGSGAAPSLEVGAKDQSVAPLARRQPCAEGDRLAVLPLPFCDLAGARSSH